MIRQIIFSNIRHNFGRVLLACLGISIGLLANLVTTYYFTHMTGGIDDVPEAKLPADMILIPVSRAYQTHPDVLHYERVVVLDANTASGIEEILVFQEGTAFAGGYDVFAGHWPQTEEEIAVPREWLTKTGLAVGDRTPLTVRFGNHYGTTWFTISGVFDSPYFTYHAPVINTAGFARAQAQDAFGRTKFFLQLREDTNMQALTRVIARESTASIETADMLAEELWQQRWNELYGDSMAWSYLLSTMLLGIAALGVINMLLLVVVERMTEIGKLKSLGVNNTSIAFIFYGESLAITVLAVVMTIGVYSLGSLILLSAGLIPVFSLSSQMVLHVLTAAAIVTFIPPIYPVALSSQFTAMYLIRSGS